MKKIFVLLLVSVFVLTAATVFATIANTKHNLTSTGGQFTRSTSDEVTMCGLCHIPHGGNVAITGLPIWARDNPATVFTVYGGGVGTLRGTTVNQPGAYSLTCLSCHDGTVAVGTYVKNTIATAYGMQGNVDGSNRLVDDNPATAYNPVVGAGGVLGNDHPVGFTYTNPGAGGGIPGINIPITASPPRMVGATSGASFPLFMGTDQFECATCHDPHLENTGTTRTKFLRSPNAQICQDCHNLK